MVILLVLGLIGLLASALPWMLVGAVVMAILLVVAGPPIDRSDERKTAELARQAASFSRACSPALTLCGRARARRLSV